MIYFTTHTHKSKILDFSFQRIGNPFAERPERRLRHRMQQQLPLTFSSPCRDCTVSISHIITETELLPPAYVVRREGYVLTYVCLSVQGGYPYPIMLCNISQNAMGQTPGGGTLPGPAGVGGYPAGGGVPCQGVPR